MIRCAADSGRGPVRWGGVRCHLALSFPGKNLLFLLTLAILMVPYATLLIPLC